MAEESVKTGIVVKKVAPAGVTVKKAVIAPIPDIEQNSTRHVPVSEGLKPEVAPAPAQVAQPQAEAQEGGKEGGKHPGGRPTKKDPITIGKLEQAFALDATVKEACFYAGIHPDTYYAWMKEDPELSDRLEALRETPVLAARESVVNALKKDPDLSLRYLERKRKKEFSPRVEHTGPDGKDLIPLNPEQEAKLDRIAQMGKGKEIIPGASA